MLYNLIFNLIIVHIVCDFYLQTTTMCRNKVNRSIKGYALWVHVAIIGLLTWVVVWDINGWWLTLLYIILHFLVDWLKSFLELRYNVYIIKKNDNTITDGVNRRYDLYFFIADQLAHIIFIILLSYIWYNANDNWTQFEWVQQIIQNHPLKVYTVVALLIILKPTNILILQILRYCKLDNNTNCGNEESFHAGALIGYTERILMTIFVILSQYEALGFLIAAKTILRFNEASSGNTKSEYVLTGTLLSLVFSLIIGLCVVKCAF